MLIDLHCHTLPRSLDSSLSVHRLIELAKQRGLDGICLTEHDRTWPAHEIAELRRQTGFLILHAVELSTDVGHVLAFGLAPDQSLPTLAAAAEAAQRDGGLLYLAHPTRESVVRFGSAASEALASVEAINGAHSRLHNGVAAEMARTFPLPGIGGSDAHSEDEVGRAATRFSMAVTDNASLLLALRGGHYEAVALA